MLWAHGLDSGQSPTAALVNIEMNLRGNVLSSWTTTSFWKVDSSAWSCPCTLTEYHAIKAYWESGGIAPRIIDLGTRWRRVVSFTPRPLYPQGKSPWYPLDRRMGGSQSRSGRGGEETGSQPLSGLESPIIQLVAHCYTYWATPAR
jgi:hypothetical protein